MTTSYSPHATSLTNGDVVEESELGSIRRVNADKFPILQRDVHQASRDQPRCHAHTALARQRQ